MDGEILSETRNGVERDYLPDPLGSTAALLDENQQKTDEWTYWPYGEVRTRTGTNPTPHQYVGTLGYSTDDPWARIYVRQRILTPEEARWLTVDPLWPREKAYCYALNAPVTILDSMGMSTCIDTLFSDLKKIRPSVNPGDIQNLRECISKAKGNKREIAKCLLPLVQGPLRSAIITYACCGANMGINPKTGKKGDPCVGNTYDNQECCDVTHCSCVIEQTLSNRGGLPHHLEGPDILCEGQVQGEIGCDNYTRPRERKGLCYLSF